MWDERNLINFLLLVPMPMQNAPPLILYFLYLQNFPPSSSPFLRVTILPHKSGICLFLPIRLIFIFPFFF
jgi:hypothetical protein